MIALPSARSSIVRPIPSTWDIGIITSSVNEPFYIVLGGSGPNLWIDWGDGTVQNFNTVGTKSHTYSSPANYTIKVSGSFINGSLSLSRNLGGIYNTGVVSTSIVPPISGLQSISVRSCINLEKIPDDLFRYNSSSLTTSAFNACCRDCSSLKDIPENLFKYATGITTSAFTQSFYNCSGITSIPENLFFYNTEVTSNAFSETFSSSKVTGIPVNLFKNNTKINTVGFGSTFRYTPVTSNGIPSDLFKYNNNLSTSAFSFTFSSCPNITYIPSGLFKNNTNLTTSAFSSTFRASTGIISIPDDIFQYNTGVTTNAFNYTFFGCSGLNGYAINPDLLRYNVNLSGASTALGMFSGVALDSTSYSNLLTSLNTYLPQSGLGFNAGNSKYNSLAVADRTALTSRGWNILDGGPA